MTTFSKISHNFIIPCHQAIRSMREAGMNDYMIGCVLTEVRSAAITEERMRLDRLTREFPPYHATQGEMTAMMDEWSRPDD